MASVNKVILVGNLTKNPETRNVGQSTITELGLAVNRKYKTASGESREEVTFINATAWGKQGEVIAKYMSKGKPIYIEGRLKLDTWEDKNGGGKRSKLSVVVENFQFLGGKSDAQDGGRPRENNPISQEEQFTDNEIPF